MPRKNFGGSISAYNICEPAYGSVVSAVPWATRVGGPAAIESVPKYEENRSIGAAAHSRLARTRGSRQQSLRVSAITVVPPNEVPRTATSAATMLPWSASPGAALAASSCVITKLTSAGCWPVSASLGISSPGALWLVTGNAGAATTKPAAAIVEAKLSNASGRLSKPCAMMNNGKGARLAGCQISVRRVRVGAPGNSELGGVGRVVSTHVRSLRVTAPPTVELATSSVLSPHAASVKQASTHTALSLKNA